MYIISKNNSIWIFNIRRSKSSEGKEVRERVSDGGSSLSLYIYICNIRYNLLGNFSFNPLFKYYSRLRNIEVYYENSQTFSRRTWPQRHFCEGGASLIKDENTLQLHGGFTNPISLGYHFFWHRKFIILRYLGILDTPVILQDIVCFPTRQSIPATRLLFAENEKIRPIKKTVIHQTLTTPCRNVWPVSMVRKWNSSFSIFAIILWESTDLVLLRSLTKCHTYYVHILWFMGVRILVSLSHTPRTFCCVFRKQ